MSGKELLALAALVSLGLQQTPPISAQEIKNSTQDSLRATDRSSLLLAKGGKSMVCGKCGANGCGPAYMARVRHQHTAQMKKLHTQKRNRSFKTK
jgi:hypothetical protein